MASGAWNEEMSYRGNRIDLQDINIAEAVAIEKAVQWAKDNNIKNLHIVTDSQTCFYGIMGRNWGVVMTQKQKTIIENIKGLIKMMEVHMTLTWTKSHTKDDEEDIFRNNKDEE